MMKKKIRKIKKEKRKDINRLQGDVPLHLLYIYIYTGVPVYLYIYLYTYFIASTFPLLTHRTSL